MIRAVQLCRLRTCGRDRRLRQSGGVSSHIGDEASLVQPLCHAHGALSAPPQFAARFLLQGRGHERSCGRATVGLVIHRAHRECRVLQSRRKRGGRRFVEVRSAFTGQDALLGEVLASGDSGTIDSDQRGAERTWIEQAVDVPIRRGTESDALTFAVDNEAGSHRLDPSGGKASHHLLPQNG